jgi:hypothetical protein
MQPRNFAVQIHVPDQGNVLLRKALKEVNANPELKTLWEITNTNAITRLGFSDHGPVHFQIVSNLALRITRILIANDVEMSVVRDYELTNDHAELIVFLGSIMHDLGMSIERNGHEEMSLFLANNILRETLSFLNPREKTIVISEVLHTIISHRAGGDPLTIEAGIVRVADALDMSKGRSRIPYQKGSTNIHAVSAAAIDNVTISEGKTKPVSIQINMNNSAGIFQIDELLKQKVKGSGLEKYLTIRASLDRATEKKLMQQFELA